MREGLIVNGICALIAAGALGLAGWIVVSGQILNTGIDALFIVLVCLLMALLFSLGPLSALRAALLQKKAQPKKGEKPAQEEGKKAAAN
jgi:TRAP-type C4-dicarboxylate transport system permease small subunit